MLNKNMKKRDVEEVLEGKGDFVKIDYLTRYLKQMPPLEMRKFAYLKLAEIYNSRKMFFDSAKAYKNVALNSLIFKNKIENFLKSAKSYVKAGEFIEADKAIKQAMNEANSMQRKEIYSEIKNFYKEHALELEKNFKTNSAIKAYEKLLRMNLNENEELEIKEKLKNLYGKLGMFKEKKLLEGV